jgi:hypothetical protein
MSRSVVLALAFVASAYGAIWPGKLGDIQLKSTSVFTPAANQAQLAEYGFDTAEQADYGDFRVTALRFKDVTGAYAASLDSGDQGYRQIGNYLISCSGRCPKNLADLADSGLPHVSHGSAPNLDTHFPAKGLLPRSERYILGPVSLAGDAPGIPESAVNFDFGTEGEVGQYRTSQGTVILGVFSFPTPSIARQQLPQFQKIANAEVKRSGPLVVIAMGPSPANSQLLKAIEYQGVVEENEKPPEKPLELKPESAGKMVLAILSLAGLLLIFCLLSGLAVGGALRLARRFGYSAAEGSLTTLHLEGK